RGRAQASLFHAEESSHSHARQEPRLGRPVVTAPICDDEVGEPRKLLHSVELILQSLSFIPGDHRDAVSGPPAPKLEAVTGDGSRNGIPAPQVARFLGRTRHSLAAYTSAHPFGVAAASALARLPRSGSHGEMAAAELWFRSLVPCPASSGRAGGASSA